MTSFIWIGTNAQVIPFNLIMHIHIQYPLLTPSKLGENMFFPKLTSYFEKKLSRDFTLYSNFKWNYYIRQYQLL